MIKDLNITNRISALRSLMTENQIDAYLITGTDPHLSEYIPEGWKTREWISGFTGSYGKVLVTQDHAMLWTDTRYFIQATEELSGTNIELMKERVPGAISVEDWIIQNLKAGNKVAVDGLTISAADSGQISSKLYAKGILFSPDTDLVTGIWKERPIAGGNPVYEHPVGFAGKPRGEKIEMVRKMLLSTESDATVISMLDDVAWLFNLRGDEILYTPLFTAYGYIDQESVWLFIDPTKITGIVRKKLEDEGIKISSYDSFLAFLARKNNQRILIDPLRTNSLVVKLIFESNIIERAVSLTTLLKARKDPKEIKRIKSAHLKDGAAMVYALHRISRAIGKENITEVKVGQIMNEYRSKQSQFKGDSFHPIVGFGPHGAIVHYHATNQSDSLIEPDNILLIDSGGQYLDGTTDITRTISTGTATKKQRTDFTICLKGHIALANAIYPEGTKGYSLDAITRKPLWDKAINYGHGTGHGIGYFLSVHEGPMSIRAEFNNEPIREGHLLSNEPGIYREGEYGIRIENVILCKKYQSNAFGNFLCFETISLCPIDRKLIRTELLSQDELKWINHYHETVCKKISPLIPDNDVREWLITQCAPLNETN